MGKRSEDLLRALSLEHDLFVLFEQAASVLPRFAHFLVVPVCHFAARVSTAFLADAEDLAPEYSRADLLAAPEIVCFRQRQRNHVGWRQIRYHPVSHDGQPTLLVSG